MWIEPCSCLKTFWNSLQGKATINFFFLLVKSSSYLEGNSGTRTNRKTRIVICTSCISTLVDLYKSIYVLYLQNPHASINCYLPAHIFWKPLSISNPLRLCTNNTTNCVFV